MISVDSEFYINNATLITQGEWPPKGDLLYLSYSSLLAVLQVLDLEAAWIVAFQVFMSAAALFSIYKITQSLSKNHFSPIVATVLYILWFKFQQWNLIVYTDALFANSAVVSIFLLTNAKNKMSYVFAIIMIAFTTFLRPMGIGFLFAVLSYFLYDRFTSFKGRRVVKVGVLVFLVGFFLIILNEVLREFVSSFLKSYAAAEIIYPMISFGIEQPENLIMPNDKFAPLLQLFLFIFRNPFYMFKISLLKAILFLGHIKPYYSFLHNLGIICFLYPVYFFTLKSIRVIR